MALRKKSRLIPIKRNVTDFETGEIVSIDDFLTVTEFDLGNWIKLMSIDDEVSMIPFESLGVPFMIFYIILRRAHWEDCTVDIGPSCRNAISSFVKIKNGMIHKYITDYCNSKLLKKIKGTSYLVNPRFFFIGDKTKQIQLLKKYNDHGQKF